MTNSNISSIIYAEALKRKDEVCMNNELLMAMIEYESGVPHRIQHFLKVRAFANIIAEGENLDDETKYLIDTAALVHDIGIKPSLEKYKSSAGKYQEQEGPSVCTELLTKLGFDEKIIERVSYLVGHHHTYSNIDGIDYRILVEADFLVNIFEEEMSREAAMNVRRTIFKTKTGTHLFDEMYN